MKIYASQHSNMTENNWVNCWKAKDMKTLEENKTMRYITPLFNFLEEEVSMPISSQATKVEGSETIENSDVSRVRCKCSGSAQPPEAWGEDIVRSLRKRKAVESALGNWVENKNGCHIWQGGTSHGYGSVRIKEVWGSTPIYTHRASYLMNHGPIPKGMNICHKCDNHLCINPDHLFVGTQADNLKDMKNKKRQAFGERNGMVKVSNDTVEQIRDLKRAGMKQYTIAEKFNLSQAQISRIIRGRHRSDAKGEVQKTHGNYKHGKYSTVCR